jgi:HD-like signal output (HDOD) protein
MEQRKIVLIGRPVRFRVQQSAFFDHHVIVSRLPLSDSERSNLVQSLPTSPRLMAELGVQLQKAEVPLEEVTQLLRRDPALTARLIVMANSAAYARAEPAASLEEAVACIGFREVYRLVGALAANQLANEPLRFYGIETSRFRENALFVALVMEELAVATGSDPRAAYTTGLLRSVGKVGLDRHARQEEGVAPLAPDTQTVVEWEQLNWGCSNAQVAASILAGWRFPIEMANAVREHYAPGTAAPALGHLLNIAAGAADLRGFGFRGEESYWQFTPENFDRTGVDEGKLVWAGERAFQALTRISSALG